MAFVNNNEFALANSSGIRTAGLGDAREYIFPSANWISHTHTHCTEHYLQYIYNVRVCVMYISM